MIKPIILDTTPEAPETDDLSKWKGFKFIKETTHYTEKLGDSLFDFNEEGRQISVRHSDGNWVIQERFENGTLERRSDGSIRLLQHQDPNSDAYGIDRPIITAIQRDDRSRSLHRHLRERIRVEEEIRQEFVGIMEEV